MSEVLIKEVTVGGGLILRAALDRGDVVFSLLRGDVLVSQTLSPAVAATLVAMATKTR